MTHFIESIDSIDSIDWALQCRKFLNVLLHVFENRICGVLLGVSQLSHCIEASRHQCPNASRHRDFKALPH